MEDPTKTMTELRSRVGQSAIAQIQQPGIGVLHPENAKVLRCDSTTPMGPTEAGFVLTDTLCWTVMLPQLVIRPCSFISIAAVLMLCAGGRRPIMEGLI